MQQMSILESFVRTFFSLILVAISVMEIHVFLNSPHSPKLILVKTSEYDQEIPQSHNADQPIAH